MNPENINTQDPGSSKRLEEVVIRLAQEKKLKIATAESCTGGLIAHRLTTIPGSSEVFEFGWVTYANRAKTQELGVSLELLAQYGAVSQEVALAMAQGALGKSQADWAVAVTGIAGPSGGTREKPVGTVCIALASKRGSSEAVTHYFPTSREDFKSKVSEEAFLLLIHKIQESPTYNTVALKGDVVV